MPKNYKENNDFYGIQTPVPANVIEGLPDILEMYDGELKEPIGIGGPLTPEHRHNLTEDFEKLTSRKQLLVRAFMVALQEPDYPKKVRALYEKRKDKKENPANFIKRVYSAYMHDGLPRAQIKRLDPKLYEALNNWLRTNELPDWLNLPKSADRYDRLAEAVLELSGDPAEVSADLRGIAKGLKIRSLR